jgi:8-oxo-dGTP diphosphatase
MERKHYVVGFLMDPTLSKVVLIRKIKPEWQQGLLNGVGGKVGDNHPNETAEEAMHREFAEEAGVEGLEWKHYLTLETPHSHISFFRATGNVHRATTKLDEEVGVYDINEVMDRCDTMPNLRWCIQMARTFHFGERADKFECREIMEEGVENSMGGGGYKLGDLVEDSCKHCGSIYHRTPLHPDVCEAMA